MSLIPSRWRALTLGLAAAVGLGGTVQAQTLAPREAPKAWVAYAELATQAVSAWLSEDSEPAGRLRQRLLGSEAAADRAVELELKVWIDAEGAVSKVEAPALADLDAGADLAAVVAERRLPPPPPRMLQPLRLAIDLERHPEGSTPN